MGCCPKTNHSHLGQQHRKLVFPLALLKKIRQIIAAKYHVKIMTITTPTLPIIFFLFRRCFSFRVFLNTHLLHMYMPCCNNSLCSCFSINKKNFPPPQKKKKKKKKKK